MRTLTDGGPEPLKRSRATALTLVLSDCSASPTGRTVTTTRRFLRRLAALVQERKRKGYGSEQ
jgi:hypothetical protein